MEVHIKAIIDKNREKKEILNNVLLLTQQKSIYANVKDARFEFNIDNNVRVYLFGDIFYYIENNGSIVFIEENSTAYLKNIFSKQALENVIRRLEGQYVGFYVDNANCLVRIFSDRYARIDCFYGAKGRDYYFSTDLDFIFQELRPQYDQKMIAHFFSVYGWYTPKGLTIYENIRRLRVGEIITVSKSGIRSEIMEFKPLEIQEYTDKELETYYAVLRDSVVARANRRGTTWVSSSSGWDSSILLGILINELGHKKVRMLIGRMKYSEKTDIINKFEIDKIKKIGKFYGVKPEIEELDYRGKDVPAFWQKIAPFYKSKHSYAFAVYNFSRLSLRLREIAGEGAVIFNGETSDSFHNFGFSQFATFFHSKKSFTEYADKMNCYLYGPSFFKKVLDGTHERDKVFQIFTKMMGNTEFAPRNGDRADIIQAYLYPFFYGSPRVPFAKTYNNPLFNEKSRKTLYHFPFREYMPEVLLGLTEKNIYSWLIYLYHSFHSQGSTVNAQKYAMEMNNHHWRSPFNDYRLIEFLSKAPEYWGRGLDLNNTKYPLKWVAKTKIRFPYEMINRGAHSYLYDVIEGFSLAAEVVYRSGMTPFLKDILSNRCYRGLLSEEYFNMPYLDKIVSTYLNGQEVSGNDFNNLLSLINLCIIGWY